MLKIEITWLQTTDSGNEFQTSMTRLAKKNFRASMLQWAYIISNQYFYFSETVDRNFFIITNLLVLSTLAVADGVEWCLSDCHAVL